MHDGGRTRFGELGFESAGQLVHRSQFRSFISRPLLPPASHITRKKAVGTTKFSEPYCLVVNGVKPGEYIDQLPAYFSGVLGTYIGHIGRSAQDAPRHVLHHVERGTNDFAVGAQRNRTRHWYISAA